MTPRLIEHQPASVVPSAVGIVHLGLGAFHRAHQAVYLQRWLNAGGDPRWGIEAANLRANRGLVARLRAAGHRYQVIEYADDQHVTVREIASIAQVRYTGPEGEELEALLETLVAPATRIVTLTVTEKGYCLQPSDGALDERDPLILHDLEHPDRPRSAPGLLVAALAERRARGTAPFTVLSCDNLAANGERVRSAVVRLAALRDPALAGWIEAEVAFPSSMVDRIVPRVDETTRSRLGELGVSDPDALACESFSQWVIEDRFPLGRPDWERVGVTMVASVAPFEEMKLRMLNGSHSLLAYLGLGLGHCTVDQAVLDPRLRRVLERYLEEEAAPSLEAPGTPGAQELAAYAESLLERFANPSLGHRLDQIAMDGSQKLPQRWLSGLEANLAAGRGIAVTALGLAGWLAFIVAASGTGELDDPLAELLFAVAARPSDQRVEALLCERAIFHPGLAGDHRATRAVAEAYQAIDERGVEAALEDAMEYR